MSSLPIALLRSASRNLTRLSGEARTVVLTYHRVLESPDAMRPGEVTAEDFDAQMGVVSSSFPSETLGSLVRRRNSDERGGATVVVTFDDGYKDNHDVALPILQKHGVRATFFVASGYLEGGMMWNDQLIEAMRASIGRTVDLRQAELGELRIATIEDASRHAQKILSTIKRWPQQQRAEFVDEFAKSSGFDSTKDRTMMTAKEVAALADAGMEIGAHTVTHPILSTLSENDAWDEIVGCKSSLERIVGREVQSFAYPNGRPDKDFTEADVERVRAAGYAGAATTEWGCVTPNADSFRIPRQSLWGSNRSKIWYRLLRNFMA